ncbi:MAG: Crossover junction endodeoxyribonuclease RuvC [Chlamydiia bacterium]|nr:Crossover junction endodeoxyribonuclease RuvC [Chlamydiia bacterium]MCH9624096.1 Crossover junction endodeoxyribonuclease RuvC [Chlamydiia bacterium]
MIILGIDPGTARTGWGVIETNGSSYKLLACGVIAPKTKVLSEKYVEIFDEINSLIDQFQPHCISVETQFVSKNPQSAIKIGMARGMAILAGAKRSIPIFEYTPLKAKKAVTGSGKAQKEDMQKMIGLLLSTQKRISHDAADALALAICHSHHARSPLSPSI